MLKTKQRRFAIVAVLLFSMIAMYGGTTSVNAGNMDSAKTTLDDSDLSAQATSTIVFDLNTADLTVGQYVTVSFDDGTPGFTTIAATGVECPSDSTASASGNDVTCTVVSTLSSTTPHTIEVPNVTNPDTAGDYSVTVTSYTVGNVVIDSSETKVYIIDDVTVTAHVAASLTFAVAGVATTTVINGDTTTGSTSPTEIAFKTLDVDTEQLMGQVLTVSTNANSGYTVTVQQDGNMMSAAGADIDSFNTGGPIDWVSPSVGLNLSDENTYGYMGVASDDSDLATSFTAGFYQGLDGTTALEVMSHDGPADGTTADAGEVSVMYNIEITDVQEAGDYQNTLTYVCTPTF